MYQPNLGSAISVNNFGAQADGVSDNMGAFQRAIEYCKTNRQSVLFVPNGTYVFQSPVYISGATGISIVSDNARIITPFESNFKKFVITGSKDINFSNLIFDGGRTGSAILGNNFSGIITYEDSVLGVVENCQFFNQRGAAILVYGASSNITINENYFSGHFCGIYSNAKTEVTGVPSRIIVTNNRFGPTWANGNETACIKLQNAYGSGIPSYGHIVANNNISSTCQMGVEFWNGSRGIVVEGNIFSGTTWGISLDNASDATVNGNTCIVNQFAGIETASNCFNVQVNGNVVDAFALSSTPTSTGQYGLLVANGGKNISFADNYVRGYSYGCQIFGTNDNITLDNNVIDNCIIHYNPQGSFTNLTLTNNKFNTGITCAYLGLFDFSNTNSSGIVIRGNYFNGATTDQSLFFYNNLSSGTLTNVIIENNVVGPNARGGANGGNVFVGGQVTPYNFICRNNFAVSGATAANSIQDFNNSSSSAYGTSNIKDGFQYYGNYSWIPDTGLGITGDGIWLCLWSGGQGKVNNPRVRVQCYSSYNNAATTVELWASCIPYLSPSLTHTLSAIPQGVYFASQVLAAKTLSQDVDATNSVWVKMNSITTGITAPVDIYYSEQNLLGSVYATYVEPPDTQNNAKLYFNQAQYQDEMFKLSRGISVGNNVQVYSDISGVLTINAPNGIIGLTGVVASVPNAVYTTGNQTITGLKSFNSGIFYNVLLVGTNNNTFTGIIQLPSGTTSANGIGFFDTPLYRSSIGVLTTSNPSSTLGSFFQALGGSALQHVAILGVNGGNGTVDIGSSSNTSTRLIAGNSAVITLNTAANATFAKGAYISGSAPILWSQSGLFVNTGQTGNYWGTGANGAIYSLNNGNVGIGSSIPVTKLDVSGDITYGRNGGSSWTLQSPLSDGRVVGQIAGAHYNIIPNGTGYVGISTTSPIAPLHVIRDRVGSMGQLRLQGANNDAAGLSLYGRNPSNATSRNWAIGKDYSTFGLFEIQTSTTNTGDPSSTVLVISGTNVGIGVSSPAPDIKLHVGGNAKFENFASSYNTIQIAASGVTGYIGAGGNGQYFQVNNYSGGNTIFSVLREVGGPRDGTSILIRAYSGTDIAGQGDSKTYDVFVGYNTGQNYGFINVVRENVGQAPLVLNPDNNSNIGVGYINPPSKLSVSGDARIEGNSYFLANTGSPARFQRNTSQGLYLELAASGVTGYVGARDNSYLRVNNKTGLNGFLFGTFVDTAGSFNGTYNVIRSYSGDSTFDDPKPYDLFMGYQTGLGYGYIQPIRQGIGFSNFVANPNGGNMGVGHYTPPDKLSVSGNISVSNGNVFKSGTVDISTQYAPFLKPQFSIVFNAGAASPPGWTNMPAAANFFKSASSYVSFADLTNYTGVQLIVNKDAVAGTTTGALFLRYSSNPALTFSNFLDIDTASSRTPINVANVMSNSGFFPLVAGAKSGVYIALCGSGGNGVSAPVFGMISANFK